MSFLRKTTAIFLCLTLSIFLSKPAITIAAETNTVNSLLSPISGTSIFSAADEFCQKRSGELMNLETWFSGKCGEDVKSSIQGEGVGFVDIITLQGLESLFSLFKPVHIPFAEYIIKTLEWINTNTKNANNLQNKGTGQINITPPPFSNSLTGNLSQGLGYMFNNKPASSTEYIAYVSNNLKRNKIIENTYAADGGYGFQALSPVLPIWKAFRNIAYMLFAIAFVMYGVMIMFRIRIDSKTAANITLAIPKLVTTLLLITFSYAIVGLLVDITTVLMSLSIDVLRVGEIITGFDNGAIQWASGQGRVGLVGSLIINSITGFLVTPIVVLNIVLGGILGTAIGATTIAFTPINFTVSFIIFLIFILALLFSYGKIFFAVLKSYITIIIHLIFAPIMILGEVFPGSKSFASWIMTIIGNLAIFPVISFFLVLSYALMVQPLMSGLDALGGALGSSTGVTLPSIDFGVNNLAEGFTGFWTPPMTSLGSTVAGGEDINSGSAMLALIGLMLLFMASKYADMVTDALKVPPFKYGSAIGESLKWGYGKAGYKFGDDKPYKRIGEMAGATPGKTWSSSLNNDQVQPEKKVDTNNSNIAGPNS